MIEKNIHHSKTFKIILISGGTLIVLLTVFLAGIAVGFHKASFSYRVGTHYEALFGKNDMQMIAPPFDADEIPGGHEAAGKIIAVELPVFVVVGSDNIEKKIEIATSTVITELRGAASSSAIAIGDSVVVIGMPGADSDIAAQFIRIFPANTQ
jgi:hypothetical protein